MAIQYKKISELDAAGAVTGTELVEIVQGGVNKKATVADIAGYVPAVRDIYTPNAFTGAAITTACSAASSARGRVRLSGGDYAVTVNADFLGVPIEIEKGSRLVISTGVVVSSLRIWGDPLYQVISCAVADTPVITGPCSRPEWFGAVGDGVTSDKEAFDKVQLCGAPVELLGKVYRIFVLNLVSNLKMRGVKPSVTSDNLIDQATGTVLSGAIKINDECDIVLDGFGVYNTADDGINIEGGTTKRIKISNVVFQVYNHGFVVLQRGGDTREIHVSDCVALFGIHGFVSKAQKVVFERCKAYGCTNNGFAMVSDNFTTDYSSNTCETDLVECENDGAPIGVNIYGRDYTSENNAAGIVQPTVRIIGGRFENTISSSGITVGDYGTADPGMTFLSPRDIVIVGAKLLNNKQHGINVRRVQNLRVSSCLFRGNIGVYGIQGARNNTNATGVEITTDNIFADGLSDTQEWARLTPSTTGPSISRGGQYFRTSSIITFNTGTAAIAGQDIITGATSGTTATVISVALTSGSWVGGDAAGSITLVNQSGSFTVGELLTVSGSNKATVATDYASVGITNIQGGMAGTVVTILLDGKHSIIPSGQINIHRKLSGQGATITLRRNDLASVWDEVMRNDRDLTQSFSASGSTLAISFALNSVARAFYSGSTLTATLTGGVNGNFVSLVLSVGGTTPTVTWVNGNGGVFHWHPTAGAPLFTAANKVYTITFLRVGADYIEQSRNMSSVLVDGTTIQGNGADTALSVPTGVFLPLTGGGIVTGAESAIPLELRSDVPTALELQNTVGSSVKVDARGIIDATDKQLGYCEFFTSAAADRAVVFSVYTKDASADTLVEAFRVGAAEFVAPNIRTNGTAQANNGYYIGNQTEDGSWRIVIDGANLVHQKRVSGAWVTKNTISGA